MTAPTHPFRCIALDAVGTLIFAQPAVSIAYAEIGQRHGSRQSAEQIKKRFADAMLRADELSIARFGEPGRTSEVYEWDFWRQVVSDVLPDVSDPHACFAELFEHFARPESWRCFDDVGQTLTELERRGYRVLIASNFDARLNRVCDGLPELREVRCRVISSLVWYRKTHPGFYAAVAQAAGCEPSDVLMVGDDFVNDVESAQAAGLTAVHLRRDGAGHRLTPTPTAWASARLMTCRTHDGVADHVADHVADLRPAHADGVAVKHVIGVSEIASLTDLLEWLP
ncbi:MAG: HAD family hydrolase [Planctomycetaceae bacterium]